MRVDHRGLDIRMTQQLLDGPQISSRLQKVGGKGMPQRMRGDSFGDACFHSSPLEGLLVVFYVSVMPSDDAGPGIR